MGEVNPHTVGPPDVFDVAMDGADKAASLGGGKCANSPALQDDSAVFKGQAMNHVTEVPPVFLAYKRVSNEGHQISLVQVASAVLQVMKDDMVLDAVQPMKSGWYIYMRTLTDRAALVASGITIVGKYIQLQSEVHPERLLS